MKIILSTTLVLLLALVCTNTTWAALTQTQVSQLYVSIFGRASEGKGNSYWQLNQSDMTIAANTMLNTEPAKTYFGSTLNDNQKFIEFIYENTLGKTYAEDPDGIKYWVSELANGKPKGQVIASLINAVMDTEHTGLSAQNQFINKVSVCNYSAITISTVPDINDLSEFIGFISNVTDDSATVATAKENINNAANESTEDSQTDKSILQIPPGTSWQWQLIGDIDTSLAVDMYDIDLFNTSSNIIKELRDKKRIVICYFSAGTMENWRNDKDKFPEQVLGKTMKDWKDEKWLDIRQIEQLAPIMQARLDLAVEKCCDGVEPDNVDGYINQTGFPLTYEDQLKYNKWLANEAHTRGLSVGLKNNLDQVEDLVDHFDWALNEQCFEFDECEKLLPFINKGKAVFGVEYELKSEEFCKKANAMNFDWLYKDWDLTSMRESCR